MISANSVVALHNSFVSVDRLDTPNSLFSIARTADLRRIVERFSAGYLVETDSFEIVVSPHTLFVCPNESVATVERLKEGDQVLTSLGFEALRNVLSFKVKVPMVDLLFKDGFDIFLAEGFFLISR